MRFKKNVLQKIVSFFASILLLVNSFAPYLLITPILNPVKAQEETATQTSELALIDTVSPAPTAEPTLTPIEIATPSPTIEVTPTETPSPTIEVTTITEPTITPEGEILDGISTSNSWDNNADGSFTSKNIVRINTEYIASFNNNLTIKFTKLPENPSKVTIKEISASFDLGEGEQVGSVYEITSEMQDGEFAYDLTLPVPHETQNKNLTVKYAETVNDLKNSELINEETILNEESLTVKSLNHFTVFVLVNDLDNGGTGSTSDDIANGLLSTIQDSYIKANAISNNYGDSTSLNVRSSDNDTPDENWNALVQFDTSGLPANSNITKATLRLFMTQRPSSTLERDYDIYKITSSWVEGNGGTNNNPVDEVRWDNKPSTSGSATSTAKTPIVNNVWVEWDVTADVQDYVDGTSSNYGWLIKDRVDGDALDDEANFRSRKSGTENQRPQLVVDFSESSNEPTEYKSPTSQSSTTGGDGNGFETNATGALSDGGTSATNINGSGDRHLFYDYNFSIPSGSAINGIEVRSDWYLDAESNTNSLGVDLSWDGGTSWTTAKTDSIESDTEHISSLGGANDLWGRTWNANDFLNSNFIVRVTSTSDNSNKDFYLDWIPVRVYYTLESTPPTDPADVASTSHSASPSNDQTIDMAWTIAGSLPGATDADSGIDGYSYEFTNGATDTPDAIKDIEETEVGITSNALSDGNWYFHLRTVDNAGNWTSTAHAGPYTIDTTPPSEPSIISSSHALSTWNSDRTINISWSATDPSGIAGYSYLWDLNSATEPDIISEGTSTSTTSTNRPTSQLIYFHVRAIDEVGFWSNTTHYGPFWIDANNPTNAWINPLNGAFIAGLTNLQTNTNDSGSGINFVRFRYQLSGGSFITIIEDTSAPYSTDWDTSTLADGNYILRARAEDNSGRSNIKDINVSIDNTAPSTSDDVDGAWHNNDVTVNLTCSDGSGVGCDVIYWTTDGTSPTTSSSTGNTINLTTDGIYTIKYFSVDSLGNAESIVTATNEVKIDKTNPSNPGTPTTTSPTTNTTPTWDWTASVETNLDYYIFYWDNVAGGETNNSGNILTNLFTIPTALLDGTWYGKVKAFDAATNESSFSDNGSVLIDTSDPSTPTATNPAGDYTTDQLVTLSSDDNTGSGVAAIYYTTDGSTPDNSKTLYSSAITVDQDMTIKAIAYDNVGNVSGILEAIYGIAPLISDEASTSVTSTTSTITWTTDDLSTSRVIYDTITHPDPVISSGESPLDKYGYSNTTDEFDSSTKVTNHSVGLSGLTAGTTYYYRVVSHGSPDAVSDEFSFTTLALSTTTGTVAGASTGGVSTPTCSDTKPGSAPSGFSATAGFNSVTLSWNKASDPVSYYLVTYGLSSGSQAFGNPNVGNSSTTSYTVSNLSGGITYYFKVRAGNGCAPGEFSSEVSATPTGGFVEGPATGFEPGVLGETTEEAKLKEELENNQTLGKFTQTLKQNKLINYLPYIALLLIIIFIILKRKRKNMVK